MNVLYVTYAVPKKAGKHTRKATSYNDVGKDRMFVNKGILIWCHLHRLRKSAYSEVHHAHNSPPAVLSVQHSSIN